MTTSRADEILQQALQLPEEERERIAAALMDSVDNDDEVGAAWGAEAERRAELRRTGQMGTVGPEEVKARLDAALRKP